VQAFAKQKRKTETSACNFFRELIDPKNKTTQQQKTPKLDNDKKKKFQKQKSSHRKITDEEVVFCFCDLKNTKRGENEGVPSSKK